MPDVKNTTFLYEVIFQKAVWRRASGSPYNLHVGIHAYLPHRIVISFCSHYARTWKAPCPSWGRVSDTEVSSFGLWFTTALPSLYSPKAALIGSPDYGPIDTRLHFLLHTASSSSKPQQPSMPLHFIMRINYNLEAHKAAVSLFQVNLGRNTPGVGEEILQWETASCSSWLFIPNSNTTAY